MSGGIPALALKEEDVTKFLASATHIGSSNLDFQMEPYVFKRRSDAEGESSQKSKKKAVDCRRSTAAQFFVEEETVSETVTADRVVQLLNEAMVPKEEGVALKNLQVVQELIIHKEPKLLDNFLDEVVSFQHDQHSEVRRFVVQFIEEACKKDPQYLPKVVGNLNMMLDDSSVNVQKKVIQTTTQLYPVTIRWLCNAKKIDDVMEATWTSMSLLKSRIYLLLESDNEGVRALTIKFMECVVINQTSKDQYTDPKSGDLSLDEIPLIMKIFRPRKLEEEAKEVFLKIIGFHGASHVSSFNLMACMQVLTTIGKKRYEFFPKVLSAFESLHANLPPTLSQSQVKGVRKNLKLHLFTLVKHPGAVEFHSRISIMLSDLGATPQQISKCFPNIDVTKKRGSSKEQEMWSKKVKAEEEVKPDTSKLKTVDKSLKAKNTAIDITADDLVPKFTGTNVADLVLVSMLSLPEVMPAHFQSTYTPIAAAGTEAQVRHLARLLATQLTIAGLGKGFEEFKKEAEQEELEGSDDEDEPGTTKQIKTVVGRVTDHKPKKQALVLIPSGSQAKSSRTKKLDMQTSTKQLTDEEADQLCQSAYNRILNAEKCIAKRGAGGMRTKILTTLATQFRGDFATDLKNHILENPKSRLELAFSWLYQEYAAYRGFEGSTEGPVEKYEQVVNELLSGVLENDEQNQILFGRFFLDVPYITEGMAESLKVICTDENATVQALQIAKNMTTRRPPKKLLFLGVISELTLHESFEVRSKAVNTAVELHEGGHLQSFIEAFALRSLKFLLCPTPPSSDFVLFNEPPTVWSEELTKVCLHLYLALLPINHSLIHDLGTVYVETSADIKRTILRALEAPVKGMSMGSPELLKFVENCPKGAETLVTRIIHILTDKAPPSNELVDRVRDLYHKRVPDVRFLIPIINGLSKREVIAALPELIKLNPTVVKEVFHRLLGSNFSSPLSPSELLVALHNIDPSKCNLKIIIKATSLCFEEKNVYTQVVLAMVMQQLMEQDPLPILLMRTVIQSLANYPHLLGFVTNILQRLIVKKVWTQKRIWEGFIKCCQRTKPQSFPVLLQLPPPQLEEVLQSCPDLRDPLCQHVDNFTERQKAHIPKAIMDVLAVFKPKSEVKSELKDDTDSSEPLPPGQD